MNSFANFTGMYNKKEKHPSNLKEILRSHEYLYMYTGIYIYTLQVLYKFNEFSLPTLFSLQSKLD